MQVDSWKGYYHMHVTCIINMIPCQCCCHRKQSSNSPLACAWAISPLSLTLEKKSSKIKRASSSPWIGFFRVKPRSAAHWNDRSIIDLKGFRIIGRITCRDHTDMTTGTALNLDFKGGTVLRQEARYISLVPSGKLWSPTCPCFRSGCLTCSTG